VVGGKDVGRVSEKQWQSVIEILVEKPNCVNKKVSGQVEECRVKSKKILGEKELGVLAEGKSLVDVVGLISEESDEEVCYILQTLVAKDRFKNRKQLVMVKENCVRWIQLEKTDEMGYGGNYLLRLERGVEGCDDRVEILVNENCDSGSEAWMLKLLGKVERWLGQEDLSPRASSLQLVDIAEYSELYSNLKEKYGKEIIDNWGEVSDPEKFVHEDIGIATYLMLLWRDQRKGEEWKKREGEGKLQTFADLGCGNGLLVYILTREGHCGTGYDVRKRKIWDWFPGKLDLREEPVMPGDIYPEVDWLLGNHSDELTPWIPIMAALSGPHTSYWVLPCCPFDFTAKFQRRNGQLSLYRDYLNFVREMGEEAGFDVEEDRMRIPSTKRICLVGTSRPGGFAGWEDQKERVRKLVEMHTNGESKCKKQKLEFVPRESVEVVRNCTKVDKDLVKDIVDRVVGRLLNTHNFIDMEEDSSDRSSDKNDKCDTSSKMLKKWNSGGVIPLGDVAALLSEAGVPLSKLKSECGGLQTLLRNHHYIFLVAGGEVRLRVPGRDKKSAGKRKMKNVNCDKKKICWHFQNHPQGCPLSAKLCTWAHGEQDLSI